MEEDLQKFQEAMCGMERQRDLYKELYDQQREFIKVLISVVQHDNIPTLIIENDQIRKAKPGEVVSVLKGKKK